MDMIVGRNWCEYFAPRTRAGENGCIIWNLGCDEIGYGRTTSRGHKENKVHRISWLLAVGPIPNGMRVLHKCDIRPCVNPEHLFLGTQADNVRDMMAKGRGRSPGLLGTKNPRAKLTEAGVRAMRKLAEAGVSHHEIARRYAVAPMTANRAIRGLCWSHVR